MSTLKSSSLQECAKCGLSRGFERLLDALGYNRRRLRRQGCLGLLGAKKCQVFLELTNCCLYHLFYDHFGLLFGFGLSLFVTVL